MPFIWIRRCRAPRDGFIWRCAKCARGEGVVLKIGRASIFLPGRARVSFRIREGNGEEGKEGSLPENGSL